MQDEPAFQRWVCAVAFKALGPSQTSPDRRMVSHSFGSDSYTPNDGTRSTYHKPATWTEGVTYYVTESGQFLKQMTRSELARTLIGRRMRQTSSTECEVSPGPFLDTLLWVIEHGRQRH
jgi:hypothetical protein